MITQQQRFQLDEIRIQVEAGLLGDEDTERMLRQIGCTDDDLMDVIDEHSCKVVSEANARAIEILERRSDDQAGQRDRSAS